MTVCRILPILCLSLYIAFVSRGVAGDAPKKPAMIFSTDMSGGDLQFLNSATEQGLFQATLGALAASRAKSAEVKEFGQTIAKHHATQNEQIKLIAIKKGFTLPTGLTQQQNATTDKLAKLQGLKFDKAYMEEMVQGQQSYVTIFEQAAQSHDADIKSFAIASLPVLRQHLALVRDITGVSPRSGSTLHFRTDAAGSEQKQPEGKPAP